MEALGRGMSNHNANHGGRLTFQVYAASQVPGTEVKEAKLFSDANEWLSHRR